MENISNKMNVLSESAVYDYVADNMDDKSRLDFEAAMLADTDLREAVESEKRLRSMLLGFEDSQKGSEAVGSCNFNSLLDVLDDANQPSNVSQLFHYIKPNWYAAVGTAASVIFATVLFINYQNSQSDDFILLSENVNANNVNFNDLVEGNKVARVWLGSDIPSEQIPVLFTKYQLKPIGRAGNTWVVASSRSFSQDRLDKLALVESFEKISVISYNSQSPVTK